MFTTVDNSRRQSLYTLKKNRSLTGRFTEASYTYLSSRFYCSTPLTSTSSSRCSTWKKAVLQNYEKEMSAHFLVRLRKPEHSMFTVQLPSRSGTARTSYKRHAVRCWHDDICGHASRMSQACSFHVCSKHVCRQCLSGQCGRHTWKTSDSFCGLAFVRCIRSETAA